MDPNPIPHLHLWCPRPFGTYTPNNPCPPSGTTKPPFPRLPSPPSPRKHPRCPPRRPRGATGRGPACCWTPGTSSSPATPRRRWRSSWRTNAAPPAPPPARSRATGPATAPKPNADGAATTPTKATPTVTPTATPTVTPMVTPTVTPTVMPMVTPTVTPTTSTPMVTPTVTPPTVTPTATPPTCSRWPTWWRWWSAARRWRCRASRGLAAPTPKRRAIAAAWPKPWRASSRGTAAAPHRRTTLCAERAANATPPMPRRHPAGEVRIAFRIAGAAETGGAAGRAELRVDEPRRGERRRERQGQDHLRSVPLDQPGGARRFAQQYGSATRRRQNRRRRRGATRRRPARS
ncbi:hypothetical protein Q9966_014902 [Columba livia]|nr:hypothetical protein Q9966_014902 [Columba livia]